MDEFYKSLGPTKSKLFYTRSSAPKVVPNEDAQAFFTVELKIWSETAKRYASMKNPSVG